MTELKRITTEYIDIEDRIRLSGEGKDGEILVFWLTRRVMGRLLPTLLGWLERGVVGTEPSRPAFHRDAVQGFAQQRARAQATPQPRVAVAAASGQCLVTSVVVGHTRETLTLTLRGGESDPEGRLTLAAQPMRQWLNILHDRYRQAGWPLDGWPDWMTAESGPVARPSAALH